MNQKNESTEQMAVFSWASWESVKHPELELLYHIPNEGKRSKATGGRLKAAGLKAGVPDICLPVPKGHYTGLYIEMKFGKNKPTEKQLEWLQKLQECGHATAICYSAEQAINTIEKYLRLGDRNK